MATGKTTTAVDRITPKDPNGLRIVFAKNAANEQDVPLSTLGDQDYITKKQFDQNTGGETAPPDPTVITAGTTVTPLSIMYTGDINTTGYILRRVSDGWDNKATQVTYDGTTFTVNGDDDGSGKWLESYVFQILPR